MGYWVHVVGAISKVGFPDFASAEKVLGKMHTDYCGDKPYGKMSDDEIKENQKKWEGYFKETPDAKLVPMGADGSLIWKAIPTNEKGKDYIDAIAIYGDLEDGNASYVEKWFRRIMADPFAACSYGVIFISDSLGLRKTLSFQGRNEVKPNR